MLPVIAFLLIVAVSAETGDDVDCTLEPVTGLCQAYFPSYFYNSTSRQCESFVYGGCQGNSNRFESKRKCEVVCKSQDEVDCNDDPEVGMCQAIIPRFFYDRVSQQCKSFTYGGCGGNTNNFETYEECRDQCGAIPPRSGPDCSSPSETGLCRAYFPRFFFNTESGRCERFIYGGCGGNDNSYDSEEACQKTCGGIKKDHEVDCDAEAESGPCDAYMPSYYYDSGDETCKQFIYGGCGGNTNRFHSFDQCMSKCQVKVSRRAEPDCSSPAKTGLCKAYFPRFFYNTESGRCERFIYGGCGGNGNSYGSEEACQETCGGVQEVSRRAEPDCSSPAKTGLCQAYFPRFFYNTESGRCEKFIYGGCGGNGNSYGSEEACQETCGGVQEEEVDCEAEPETGLCRANFPMFYYNSATGSCEEFIYGGCGGNTNRFGDEDECLNRCQVKKSKKEIDCESEPETGFCRGYMPSFYFDKSTGTCERFIYGGCGGNANRFHSHEECLSACSD